MSTSTRIRETIRAAAGTGKTAELVRIYLAQLKKGYQVPEIVAITFTRKAAAELLERVSRVLHAQLGRLGKPTPQTKLATRQLSRELDIYTRDAPEETEVIERALADLGNAPVGTIDSFIRDLLSEFALDAALPTLTEGESVALDFPLPEGGDITRVLEEEARSLASPSDGSLREEVGRLAAHYTLSEITARIAAPLPAGFAAPATFDQVFGAIARQIVQRMQRRAGDREARVLLLDALELNVDPERWAEFIAENCLFDKDGRGAMASDLAQWLRSGDDSAAPESLAGLKKLLRATNANKPIKTALKGKTTEDCLAQLRDVAGARGVIDWLIDNLGLRVPEDQWLQRIGKLVISAGRGSEEPVTMWLRSGRFDDPPPELPVFIGGLGAKCRAQVLGLIAPLEDEEGRPLPGTSDTFAVEVFGDRVLVRLGSLIPDTSRHGQFLGQSKERMEQVRADLSSLAMEVNRAGLVRAAGEGNLGYDELLSCATELCRIATSDPEHPLRTRFRALLVDEVQDSSPGQIELYEAMIRAIPALDAYFVGDSRQSIYMFRNAEPHGLTELARQGTSRPLPRNWRSVANLVCAQRAMFGAGLTAAARESILKGLEPLDDTTLIPGKEEPGADRPVSLIVPLADVKLPPALANQAALIRFADQLEREVWGGLKDGDRVPTAAVLVPTWKLAFAARDILRGRLGQARAFVDGGDDWTRGRVVRDLKILLAALLDRSDQMAWLGLWKHPMVGLSDRALARIRAGLGIAGPDGQEAEPWLRHLGWVLEAAALTEPHDRADIEAFERARRPLRRAARSTGSRPTAEVLESLAAALHWREVLAVSPDSDGLAHLEVALDWVRDMDAQGRSAGEILDVLAGDGDLAEAPHLELHRPDRHVSCTTVFQAKGLKWDHVCVLSPGVAPRGFTPSVPELQQVSIEGERFWLYPVRYDPQGAFELRTDPVGALCTCITDQRKREEELRLAYVAVTRAAESVVTALPNAGARGVQDVLWQAWVGSSAPDHEGEAAPPWPSRLDGVDLCWVGEQAEIATLPRQSWVEPTEGATLTDLDPGAATWRQQAPSSLHSALSREDRDALAESIARKVLRAGGLFIGAGEPLPTPGEHGLHRLHESHWGLLAHGWCARWRFDEDLLADEPRSLELARAYLEEALVPGSFADSALNDIAEWLVRLSQALAARKESPLWQLVTRPDVELHFEYPFTGVARIGEHSELPFLVSGQTDLLVVEPDGKLTVIDFKAGQHAPERELAEDRSLTENDRVVGLTNQAMLNSYVPQLEAYAAVLDAAGGGGDGRRVQGLALWFVRAGCCVSWRT